LALQNEYHDKYDALTEEAKQELVEEFEVHKQEGMKIHPTVCACIQDVANVARNIQLLVSRKDIAPVTHFLLAYMSA
jgi:membrane carboxypeptidase/penicillin-binding protein